MSKPRHWFSKFTIPSIEDCWEWLGVKDSKNGYGVLNRKIEGRRRYFRAHRVMWERCMGTIPDGLLVLHRCDNPGCVNPFHLFLGTAADNSRDMVSKGRNKKPASTHCKRGHEFTPENTFHHKGSRSRRSCRKCIRERDRNYKKYLRTLPGYSPPRRGAVN